MSEVIPPGKPIKLVAWQLDDPCWSASLAGGDLEPGVRALIAQLDDHGVMQSVVTRRPPSSALSALRRLALADYFLVPQLGADAPAAAITEAAQRLNLALDATLVIGGEPHALGALAAALPQVRTIAFPVPEHQAALAGDPLLGASLAALEPRPRRMLYLEEQARAQAERDFPGPRQAFLASLDMQLTLTPASAGDLHRVRELVTRSNQLGVRYGDDELAQLLGSPRHTCWLVGLVDRFGDCGQVGLVLIERTGERTGERWALQLLQFSCRALPRGVDTIVLHELVRRAQAAGAALVVQARPTSKNEAMLAAYHRAGFAPCGAADDVVLLARADAAELPPVPPGVHVTFARSAQPSP
jgi:FkbH-like protein